MSDENWDDDDSAPTSAPAVSNNNGFGTNFGKGRGFKPINDSYDNNSSGFGTFEDSGRDERRPGGRSQDFGNESENKGFGGGSKGFGGGSKGFGGDNDFDNRGFGGESRGFGGGSRGFGDDQEDGENRRGGRGGRGGRGRGGRGSRGGGGGDRNYNRDDNQESGFGGSRGFGDDNNNKGFGGGGFGDENDNGFGGGSRGFGGGGGFDDDNEGDNRSGGRGRGRGGRGGRGRGGGGDRGDRGDRDNFNNDGGNDDKPEKPRESYVPPERGDDDETLFGSGVSAGINFSKYDNIEVKTSGIDIPDKIQTFQEANLRQLLMDNIIKSKYTVPTPIQKHAIPILMAGRDLMGCAQTGSGKTAAFLIPIVQKLLATDRDMSDMASMNNVEPRALVIAPTRELAIQIFDECRKFSNGSFLKCRIVYGGTAKFHQKKQLFTGCDILVATPGRLIDLVGEGKITFNAIEFVVLDEADRMLDMGFIGDVEKVLRHDTMVPAGERQTLMFSATFPQAIQELAGKFLVNYAFVVVGIVGAACNDVEQSFHKVKKSEKREKLKELLENEANNNTLNGILVFVEEKKTADFIACFLSENSFPTTSIHGDRLQREREEALNDFKRGTMNILVATSVASRGLDIKNVRLVINFDLPKEIDDYVHRIGRTGRVGNKGRAVSFYDERFDNRIQADLVKILTLADQKVPDWLSEGASGGGSGGHAKFGGEDIRSFSDVHGSQGAAQPVEEEEDW